MRLGTWHQNTRKAIDAAEALFNAGCTPVVPQLSSFWELIYPHTIEDWLRMDKELVMVCQAVLRLPGESEGADKEVTWAQKLNIPVFYSVEAVLKYRQEQLRAVHLDQPKGNA